MSFKHISECLRSTVQVDMRKVNLTVIRPWIVKKVVELVGFEDEVVVETAGTVTFRMWDIHRGEPEARCREACKRAFGLGWCSKRSPEVAIDWDFLLED